MAQVELLKRVIRFLDSAHVPYMVTGSFASSFLGRPRSTHDVDLVVDLSVQVIPKLVAAFPEPEYYLSSDAVREAHASSGMFNLIHLESGDKVDFWMLRDEPLDQLAFSRRMAAEFDGVTMHFPRAEELVLLKLRWAKLCGGSEKQMDDVRGVLRVNAESIDWAYLEHWAMRVGVSAQLVEARGGMR